MNLSADDISVHNVCWREIDNECNKRNVGQNIDLLNLNQDAYFTANVEISMEHIEWTGAVQRKPFNPNSCLITLNDLVTEGSMHGTNLLLIILSISSVSSNSLTQMQQWYNGNRGQVKTVRHDRRMVVMYPSSQLGHNTVMILFGAGCCEQFFEGDILLRDNGAIHK